MQETMAIESEPIQQVIIDRPALKEDIAKRLIDIDNEIKHLYAQKQLLVQKQLNGLPTIVKVLNVGGDKPWCRVTMTDNLNVFNTEDSIHRVATINRYESKIEYLKNEPKDK